MNKEINPNKIIEKARKIIETKGSNEKFTNKELAWLQKNGGVLYIACKKALEMRKENSNNERGGSNNER